MTIERRGALTRVEEVDTRDDKGVDDSEDDVSLVSNGLESDRSDHDDHAGEELAQMHDRKVKIELTS
jgi:fructosamine-3-kinase